MQTSPPAPGTSTPARSGPQVSPLCQDVSWTELERFLYEPSEEELQAKLLAQPAETRQRLAQALLASLGDATVTPGPGSNPSGSDDSSGEQQRAAGQQDLTASLGDAAAIPGSGTSSIGSLDPASSSGSSIASSSSITSISAASRISSDIHPRSISSSSTQTDGQVLVVHSTEAIYLDLRVVGTVDQRR